MFLVAITKTNKFEVSYDEKKTTATTQPKMRGKTKMDIKRNLCFLFDVETMTILPFNFVVFTCFCLLYNIMSHLTPYLIMSILSLDTSYGHYINVYS